MTEFVGCSFDLGHLPALKEVLIKLTDVFKDSDRQSEMVVDAVRIIMLGYLTNKVNNRYMMSMQWLEEMVLLDKHYSDLWLALTDEYFAKSI